MIAAAAARELASQTPPNGDASPVYHCPACPHEEERRGAMRAHLLACAAFRAFVLGCVRRRDLEACEHGSIDPENPHDPCIMCAVAL